MQKSSTPTITSIKIEEDNKFAYYKTSDNVVHGVPLNTQELKDYWIKLAGEQKGY